MQLLHLLSAKKTFASELTQQGEAQSFRSFLVGKAFVMYYAAAVSSEPGLASLPSHAPRL